MFASTFWAPHNFRINVIWWLGITVVATWLLARARFGNWIFAVGGDANAARNVGVPVQRFLFLGVILLMAVLVNNLVRTSAEGARR